jgi:hypothetical protein
MPEGKKPPEPQGPAACASLPSINNVKEPANPRMDPAWKRRAHFKAPITPAIALKSTKPATPTREPPSVQTI